MSDSQNHPFHGEITVSSRIIDDLSSGLYHTPAACLKELINNSYDARATHVNVFVKPDADRIIIEDDGDGISKDEFVKHFKRVSESYKRVDSDFTPGKPPRGERPKIGKIGIGFIAANELCEVLEVYSTKEGSQELLHITIDFREMRKPLNERKRNETDIVKADYKGELLEADKSAHYTHLFLTEVNERSNHAKNILAGAGPRSKDDPKATKSLYGLKAASVERSLRDPDLLSWKQFDLYSETMLNVGLNVPVKYHDNWIPDTIKPEIREFEAMTEGLGFSVSYDGTDLRKPIVFKPPTNQLVLDHFEFNGKFVNAKGYFYAQHGTVRPNELQGLLVRIRHAAVGEYDHSFWGFSSSDSPLIQRWISAEVWADDGLEDAMNIDRRTLREAHPAYVELRNAIHKHLRQVLNRATNELYKTSNKVRQAEKTEALKKSVQVLVKDVLRASSPNAAQDVTNMLVRAEKSTKALNALQRKYSVVEIMDIVHDVAHEVMDDEELALFLENLTARLLK